MGKDEDVLDIMAERYPKSAAEEVRTSVYY